MYVSVAVANSPIRWQDGKATYKELPNPEKAAKQKTDEMKKALQLTDKQYKKMYKINLAEEKERVENKLADGDRPMPGPRPPMNGGMPPQAMEGGPRPPMPFHAPDGMSADEMAKKMEKREKKIRKILTTEQYEQLQRYRERQMKREHRDAPHEKR